MVHDYWRYVQDPGFVREMLTGVRAVLGFYTRYLQPDGRLGAMPWWNYVDWVQTWQGGRPPSEAHVMPASIQTGMSSDMLPSLSRPMCRIPWERSQSFTLR